MGTLLPLATQTPGWGSQTASTYPTLRQGFDLQMYKELTRLHSRKTNNPIKEWAKALNSHFSKGDIQKAQRLTKGCSSSSPAIREMQLKTTVILCISVVSVVISPLVFLILFIWVFSLFFLMSLLKGLSVLLIFSKNQLLDLLILWIVLLVSMSFTSVWSWLFLSFYSLWDLFAVVPPILVDVGLGYLSEMFLSFFR